MALLEALLEADDGQAPEAFLGQGRTVGSSALLQADLREI